LATYAKAPTDSSYSLTELVEAELPLDELVSVGSIDDPTTGKALVNVVLLRTPPLSLESAGTVSDIADVFARRVDKFFDVLGRIPNTIGFAGYSMGTTTALEVLARSGGTAWGGNVVGMVSLAGVNFGSTAADVSVAPDPENPGAAAIQLQLLETLSKQLKIPEGNFWSKQVTRMRNRHYWGKFAVNIVPTLKKEGDQGPLPDLKLLSVKRARTMLEMALLTATSNFEFSLSNEAHANNVRRWKYLVNRILDGVGELTTDARIRWWSSHTVPTGIKYYTVAGSLTGKEEPPRAGSMTGVLLGSLDYTINLGGYKDYVKAGGSRFNDGQVGMAQARFWPQLASFLNPSQGDFETEFLGCFATHHWGLALRKGVAGTNPFPREALLKALAAKIARDVDEKRNADGGYGNTNDADGASKRLEDTTTDENEGR
jgi:pimeloyl-ACP methyl ester carboxylesterase